VDYDPLAEPSPLGLKLKKSPSFLDLIQMKLCQEKSASLAKTLPKREKEDHKGTVLTDKLKASNFPATLLKIGTWEYKSRYEGDLVAKCYFAKHKIVWEVLDGGLKNKIEIQWSDIMAIKATCPDDGPETLDVVLACQPLFFREINPQPRKHTLWQATSDFTGGQATVYRRHFVQCAEGLLGKHFEKLMQCDPRLNFLSQQPAVVLDNPYFESKNTLFGGMEEPENAFILKTENGSDIFDLGNKSASAICSSNLDRADSVATPSELNSQGTPPPVSDPCVNGEYAGNRMREIERLKLLDQIKLPGFHPSMSMSDLVNHLGQCISEQMTTVNPGISIHEEEKNSILEDIAQYLLSDSQVPPTSDEKSLMSRVNSLCCLLQRDPSTTNLQLKSEDAMNLSAHRMGDPKLGLASQEDNNLKEIPEQSNTESNSRNDIQESSAMSRKDSVGDLLLNLPRIASLPQFLYNFWEDHGAQ